MSFWTNPSKVIANWKAWIATHLSWASGLFSGDVEDNIGGFVKQFAGADGELIFKECWEAADQLADGKKFGDVAEELLKDLTTKSATLAATDFGQVLLMIQSALQIAKVAKNILTDADQQTAEKVAATTDAPEAPPAS